jgi:heme/copper-type cytochrome/quinol oxidase subunit 1
MPDASQIFWGLVVVSIFAPAFVARSLTARHPAWRRRKVLAISALPLPLINLGFASIVSVREWTSPDNCDAQSCLTLLGWVFLPALSAIGSGVIGWLGALVATARLYNDDIAQ